ncbi:GmrSD restriction endonuclease domain-containing protein [Streptomyces mexicanus]|uniref:GmrSD restriction endonuclease domain-containing protein n=1 Tax=Streptomyces mexicanus TaxID=178566 RepID=UPI00364D891C
MSNNFDVEIPGNKQLSTPDTPSIEDLMADMRRGRLAIPDFQRSFVWDPSDTQKLLVSIVARYPAGTLLFWEQKEPQIRGRSFEGFEHVEPKPSASLVLDGQQRLTSIFQALSGVGSQRYYVDLNALKHLHSESQGRIDASRLDDVVVYRDINARSAARRPPQSAADEIRGGLFPLSLIGLDRIEEWVDETESAFAGIGDWKAQRDVLRNLIRHYLRPISNYRFPVVQLPQSTPLDAVCRIFETINRTGVKLSVFELLAARFWPAGVDLRQFWERAREKHPILALFDVDAYSLLQAVSLLATANRQTPGKSRRAPSAQRSDVLELRPEEFTEYWDRVAKGAALALTFLRDECGVLSPKWLPYSMLVVPLAAVWQDVDAKRGAEHGAALQKIRRFFWCSVFSRNYDQGGNSQAGRDYADLSVWLAGGDTIPEAVRDFTFSEETLETARTNLQALYKGIMALTLSEGARDFHTGSALTPEKILQESVDAHHVFPKRYLEDAGVSITSELIINRTLIDKRTNQSIGKNAPSNYIAKMEDAMGKEEVKGILQSHLLPIDDDSPLRNNDYAGFLGARKKTIVDAIRKVTGES